MADAGSVQADAPARARDPAMAIETLRLYAGDWAAFAAWCRRQGCAALPAAPPTVAAYLDTLAGALGPGALARRAAAIGDRHRRNGHASPGADPLVRAVLRTARQSARTARAASPLPAVPPTRRRSPPGPTQLARMAAACPGDLAGLRDRALLLLAAAGLGRDLLLGLDAEHVRGTAGGVELRVPDPADPTGTERVVILAGAGCVMLCPVRALRDWLRASDCCFGPVFRKVDRWGNVEHRRLGADALRRIWCHRAAALRRARRLPDAVD